MRRDDAELLFGPRRLAQLIEALPVGVFILNAAGEAVYANETSRALLGQGISADDRSNNLAQRYSAYVAGTDEPYPSEQMPIVRALGGERSVIDDMEIDRNGLRITIEVTATPIFDDKGEVAFAVAVFQDITERRGMQQAMARMNDELEREVSRRTAQLARTVEVLEKEIRARHQSEQELMRAKAAAEHANRAKSVFLMNVSHELRTPLHHVIGFNELLAERLSDEQQKQLAQTAESSGRDLLDRIDELIELARAEMEPLADVATQFDLDDLLRDIAQTNGLQYECRSSIGAMKADEHLVRRVLMEILDRAGDESTPIIRAEHDGLSRSAVISIVSATLAARLRALAHLFGEQVPPEQSRFLQQDIDIRLAIARAHVRKLGGDIVTAAEGEVVRVVFPTNSAA